LTNFIPIFPLGIVVFPDEQLNLHIFEPRYKQLITDCYGENKPFGIPVVVSEKITDYGTLVHITHIKKVYEDGKMDIETRGGDVFNLIEHIPAIPDKLYGGAIVSYPANKTESFPAQMLGIWDLLTELHRILKVEKKYAKSQSELLSYDIAHHAGLTVEQEWELLQLFREDQRLVYLKRHLQQLLPTIREMERLKERIKLNGHFRELKGFGG
jgi:uncharacterized protein